ncbi:RHS repeat domain-containing protein [Chitinimonas naiadis]
MQDLTPNFEGQTTLYHYDAAGHLVAETDNEGHTRKEYIYLADTPVAVIDADQSVRYIHSDHLGTPRLLTNASQKAVWAWQGEPFGADQANEDPESTGTKYSFNLRFPGQYYDVETGNHYNLNRDYDPKVGRYVQSDPIGLAGGINTYAYALGNPLTYIDPLGLASTLDDCAGKNAAACAEAGIAPQAPAASSLKEIASTSEVIAKGSRIRKVEQLCEKFGGKAKDWVKKKGWDSYGNEWHWYENQGRKVGWKLAGELDPFF